MRAYRITAHVIPDEPLVVKLPPDVPEGEVEIIVLVPEQASQRGAFASLREFDDWLRQQPPGERSLEEIDRQIDDERAAWE